MSVVLDHQRDQNRETERRYSEELARFKDEITDPTRMRLLEATLEAGSSNWLTTLPIKEHGFYLEKQAFWDTLYLRYNIQIRRECMESSNGRPGVIHTVDIFMLGRNGKAWFSINDSLISWLSKETRNTLQQQIGRDPVSVFV